MPLISDPQRVEALYAQAIAAGMCLANFCTANSYTTNAIFRATYEFGQACGIPNLPIVISATANYAFEPQLVNYTPLKKAVFGLRAFLNDVDLLLLPDSPYCDLQIMLHFDHGKPHLDDELFDLAAEKYATIMFDASDWSLADNIRMTRDFVRRMQGRVLVEGAVAEIAQAAEHAPAVLTTAETAETFFNETGVFLIVPDLGTEHRATSHVAHYDGQRARQIAARIGKRSVLHGSSSLQPEYLPYLAEDGIVKVNVWTIFERVGGQAVARYLLNHLDRILPQAEIERLVQDGLLGQHFVKGTATPKLEFLREDARRDIWQNVVVEQMKQYLHGFNYHRFISLFPQ